MASKDLSKWTARPHPPPVPMEGRYVRLEPLDMGKHGEELFLVSTAPEAEERFRYLLDAPSFENRAQFDRWMEWACDPQKQDPKFFAVIDKETGKVGGRQSFRRIDAPNGVIEIGHIYWGLAIAGTRMATEAFYLFARHAFDLLGYRRLEWECNARNEPSRRAARRFGFTLEGTFRQHMVFRGENRDTEWWTMLDGEWPLVRGALEEWLRPENFDAQGKQLSRLRRIKKEGEGGMNGN